MAPLQAAVLAIVALILAPGYFFYFDVTPKTIVLLCGTALLLLVAAFRKDRSVNSTIGQTWLAKSFEILLACSIVSLWISTAVSVRPWLSAFGGTWRQFGALEQSVVLLFAWLVMRTTAGHREHARTILRGIAVAALVASLYGITQYFGWDPLLNSASYHIGEGIWTIVRPPGSFGYVTYFANWLVLSAFLASLLLALEPSGTWKHVARTALVFSVITALLTGTRAAVLGLLVGWLISACLRGWRPGRRVLAFGTLALLGGISFYFSPLGWNLRSRTRWFVEDPWGGARLALWRDSLRMSAVRPAAGFGPEVFTMAFPAFESKALAAAYPDFAHESPHNILLEAFEAQGVPGLLLLAAICGAGVVAVQLLQVRDRPAAGALAGSLAAGFVSQQFAPLVTTTALLFLTAIALGVGFVSSPPSRRTRWPAAVSAIVLALILFAFAWRLGAADHALASTRRALESGSVREAALRFQRYQDLRLPGSGGDLWYSRAVVSAVTGSSDPIARLYALEQGRAAALRATTTAEDPFNAWYNLAGFYATLNNAPGAERSLRSAIAAHPNWFKPHWTLAELLELQSRHQEAEHEAALAAELDGGKHAEVTQTLARIHARRALVTTPLLHK